jgi:hypothetical protein
MNRISRLLLLMALLILESCNGCVQSPEQTSTPSDSIVTPKIDTLAVQNDTLQKMLGVYADSLNQMNTVRFVSFYHNEMDTLTYETLHQRLDITRRFPEQITTYTFFGSINHIRPFRDTTTYRIDSNRLVLRDPEAFWKYDKYCIVVLNDTVGFHF